MFFSAIADPSQALDLTQALDDYCRENGIPADDRKKGEAARKLLELHRSGVRRPEDFSFLLANG
jgi:hypothetical protein